MLRPACGALDGLDTQFRVPGDWFAGISQRVGRELSPDEVARVEACFVSGEFLKDKGLADTAMRFRNTREH